MEHTHPLLAKLGKEAMEIEPMIGLGGLCRAVNKKADKIRFGKEGEMRPCSRRCVITRCRRNQECHFDHTYLPTDEEAKQVDAMLCPALQILKDWKSTGGLKQKADS